METAIGAISWWHTRRYTRLPTGWVRNCSLSFQVSWTSVRMRTEKLIFGLDCNCTNISKLIANETSQLIRYFCTQFYHILNFCNVIKQISKYTVNNNFSEFKIKLAVTKMEFGVSLISRLVLEKTTILMQRSIYMDDKRIDKQSG